MSWSLELAVDLVALLAAAAGGYLILKSKVRKDNERELQKLASTRGERIEDLEAKIRRLEIRVNSLESEMEAVYKIKAKEIAEYVVAEISSTKD